MEDSLSIRKLGYEYAADTYVFPTDPTLQIQKFVSGPAGVLPGVIASHRKAEVRLHSIRQPQESFIVRVFLNQPGADISTPIELPTTRTTRDTSRSLAMAPASAGRAIAICAAPRDARSINDRRITTIPGISKWM